MDDDDSSSDDSDKGQVTEHDVFIYGAELQNNHKLDDETRHIIIKRVKDREMRYNNYR